MSSYPCHLNPLLLLLIFIPVLELLIIVILVKLRKLVISKIYYFRKSVGILYWAYCNVCFLLQKKQLKSISYFIFNDIHF